VRNDSPIWSAIAGIAIVASAANLLPQVYRSWRTRSTRDISRVAIVIIIIGNVAWIAHGIHNGDAALVTANGVLLASAVVLLALKALYDKK
jgi:MtN3 and saliva related transmembrane protein